jgi:peptide-methionine (S)-S-oxide reductase
MTTLDEADPMRHRSFLIVSLPWLRAALVAAPLSLAAHGLQAAVVNKPLPMPSTDVSRPTNGPQTATFAGGCFWGTQAVFQHVEGVTNVVSGYAGGTRADASYAKVSTGTTGHTEAVRVTYDPAKLSYGKLLQIFFSVALDPTQKDRQGTDIGPQYRSVLFTADRDQEKAARSYIQQLDASGAFDKPIATQIDTTSVFYPAEAYHQGYLTLHPSDPYIVENDLPLVVNLQKVFPQVWRDTPIKISATADD